MSLYFSKDHEYIRLEGEIGVVGITNYAQAQLGDVVFVELPELGQQVQAHKEVAVVESVKAASDVYSPVSGEIVAVNAALADNPSLINEDPEGAGWFMKIRLTNKEELSSLMDQAAYQAFAGA